MKKDYYPQTLLNDYELLLSYFPSHKICRPYIVSAIKEWSQGKDESQINILEIGPGYGETTELILKELKSKITLVEIDDKASIRLADNFADYADRLNIITADAFTWIKNQKDGTYDVFTASWVVHNFPQEQREELLHEIARVLKPSGLFVVFDKILPNDKDTVNKYWDIHMVRLSELDKISRSDLKNEMIEHEKRDAGLSYVWQEREMFESLTKSGFSNIKILNRNERDVVVEALKV